MGNDGPTPGFPYCKLFNDYNRSISHVLLVYFRIRALSMTSGTDLLPVARYRAGTDGDNYFLGAIPRGSLPKKNQPSLADAITHTIFGTRAAGVDFYKVENGVKSAANDPIDPKMVGVTKDNPAFFIDNNDDDVAHDQDVPEYFTPPGY